MLLLLQLIVSVGLYKKLWAEFCKRYMIGFSKMIEPKLACMEVCFRLNHAQGSASLQIHAPSFSLSGWIDVWRLN
jgi:hypothetical protein